MLAMAELKGLRVAMQISLCERFNINVAFAEMYLRQLIGTRAFPLARSACYMGDIFRMNLS